MEAIFSRRFSPSVAGIGLGNNGVVIELKNESSCKTTWLIASQPEVSYDYVRIAHTPKDWFVKGYVR